MNAYLGTHRRVTAYPGERRCLALLESSGLVGNYPIAARGGAVPSQLELRKSFRHDDESECQLI